MDKCWICGNVADSKEHKFKASDIKRIYGKKFDGFYVKEDPIPINSYKDKSLKFPPVICEVCNVITTRPHDDSYDIFIDYCINNYELLLNEMVIDFRKIYGNNWSEQKRNLYRYYAKHAGCKIITSKYPQDLKDLSDFILGANETKKLVLYFELKTILKIIHNFYNRSFKYGHLFNSMTLYYGYIENLTLAGWLSNHWITSNWVYSKNLNYSKIPNFDNPIETLSVIDIHYYDEKFIESATFDAMITHFEYGELNTLDKRVEHFKKIIE